MAKPDKFQLLAMLKYCRPEGSEGQYDFCDRFLTPVMGEPDEAGNYTKIIGEKPRIAFMAHHDTVHMKSGKQTLKIHGETVKSANSNCLGADCTTGCWLILHMIKNKVPGVYVIHSGEEVGGLGAGFIVSSSPAWMRHVEIALSLDRKGTRSIITHQSMKRTASDTFAHELSMALGGGYIADDGGTFTDSDVYSDVISECSNLSVGYYNQHTSSEWQDLSYAVTLAKKLVDANWDTVKAHRDPEVVDYSGFGYGNYTPYSYTPYSYADPMTKLVAENPHKVAKILEEFGYTLSDLEDELRVSSKPRAAEYLLGYMEEADV